MAKGSDKIKSRIDVIFDEMKKEGKADKYPDHEGIAMSRELEKNLDDYGDQCLGKDSLSAEACGAIIDLL